MKIMVNGIEVDLIKVKSEIERLGLNWKHHVDVETIKRLTNIFKFNIINLKILVIH